MRIARVYSPTPLAGRGGVRLGGAAARHLALVLRLERGAAVTLFDGSGLEYPGAISRLGRGEIDVELGAPLAADRESPLAVELLPGISRGERMDFTVQKATELGVECIRPAVTSRGVVRLEPARAMKRQQHWQRVAIGACEQCGRNRLPRIEPPRPFADCLASSRARLRLVLDPEVGVGLGAFHRPSGGVVLLVGPEGGLNSEELALAETAGFRRVRLGPRLLRTETAAIAGLAAVLALWGDLS